MIVWLASYPRSGNTLLRLILHHVFNLRSCSVYNDLTVIGAHRETAAIVGHDMLGDSCSLAQLGCDKDTHFVKTHEHPEDGNAAIYMIRDGRDAVTSYAHYQREFVGSDLTVSDVIVGRTGFGSWSEHVSTWSPATRSNTLLIRFESLLYELEKHTLRLSKFLRLEPVSNKLPSFSELHALNPAFFRAGSTGGWRDLFTADETELFWQTHGNVMSQYGYDRDDDK